MNQNHFRVQRHLTPELFDHYVAKAREERAKAIAAFGQQVIAAAQIVSRLIWRRRHLASPLDRADPLTR